MSEIVFLFGAGASKGTGNILPHAPPLMNELYDELAKFCPKEWGKESPLAAHRAEFIFNFENAFTEFVMRMAPDMPPMAIDSLTLLEKQIPLARYFSRFVPDETGMGRYSELLNFLNGHQLIRHSTFFSLNYECLFELSAARLGFHVDHSCQADNGEFLRLGKLHGSCNFITKRIAQWQRAQLASPNLRLELGLQYLPAENLKVNLQEKFSDMDPTYLPVMSQVSHGKELLVAPVQIQKIRNFWKQKTNDASTIVVIGVSHNNNDTHILNAIRNSHADEIAYIGSEPDFIAWIGENSSFNHLGKTFESGFENLLLCLSQCS